MSGATTAELTPYEHDIATAILGVDTIWGGDVSSPSGANRFIADCWFSGKPFPEAYTDPLAASLRRSGGLSAPDPDRSAVLAYLDRFDLPAAFSRIRRQSDGFTPLRRRLVLGLVDSLQVMLDLALEAAGQGPPVSYARCVLASTGEAPRLADAARLREEVGALLAVGEDPGALLAAVDHWRRQRRVEPAELARTCTRLVEQLDELTCRNVLPHLPQRLRTVPRTNVTFLPIRDAWFSGSMNYLGRARTERGEPEYEATYEINASLEISEPELAALVAHEVVPGHVMTFALIQHLQFRGRLGMEATILTMNTRATTLHEGIANAAPLLAHGVGDVQALPDEQLRLGLLLARLQDVAKCNASYLTWAEGRPRQEVSEVLRQSCLVSPERAEKLAGPWARHPILGRMYLPCYEIGTSKVLRLLTDPGPEKLLPLLYGAHGLLDCVTLDEALATLGRTPAPQGREQLP
ncbi:MAG: hypothetical protein FJ125_05890 [Deltaproteobacteria bacterium]|nr:hypothetical protein [Deltaproteobacteria bacterium]